MQVMLIAGLGYGDEGKGTTVDAICRQYSEPTLVVRYNGGCQAAHHVVTPHGQEHCFSQYGSGSFAGADTYVSKHMLIDPFAWVRERAALTPRLEQPVSWQVHPDAVVVTPYHRVINQRREMFREIKHGSCGLGVGEAFEQQTFDRVALRAIDLCSPDIVRERLETIWGLAEAKGFPLDAHYVRPAELVTRYKEFAESARWAEHLALTPRRAGYRAIVFEGAQGMLIDRHFGFHPHVSWTDATFTAAEGLIREWGLQSQPKTRIGVTRGYMTRHGAGPFQTESPWLTSLPVFREQHNASNQWQGGMRVGYLDLPLVRYAAQSIGGVDMLSITNLDRLFELRPVQRAEPVIDLLEEIAPAGILSYGPTADSKIFRSVAYEQLGLAGDGRRDDRDRAVVVDAERVPAP